MENYSTKQQATNTVTERGVGVFWEHKAREPSMTWQGENLGKLS